MDAEERELFSGKTDLLIDRINLLKSKSIPVSEKTSQAGVLSEETYHHNYGATLKFNYWVESELHMTSVDAFATKEVLSKLEQELSQPKCTNAGLVVDATQLCKDSPSFKPSKYW